MNMQNRFKSVVTWTAVAAQILSILVVTGTITPEWSETINAAVGGVLQLLVLFGVLNNPTDKTHF